MRETYARLKDRVRVRLADAEPSDPANPYAGWDRKSLLRAAREAAWEEGLVLDPIEMQGVLEGLVDEILGLGPLEALVRDEEVSEIMVNGSRGIYVEREGRIHPCPVRLDTDEEIYRIIDRIISPLGLHVDEASPYVDARLPDGSRVNVILPPLSLLGPVVTIRKFRRNPFGIDEMISGGTLTHAQAAFLSQAVKDKRNVVISGGAGTGKTTLLGALSAFIGEDERIITLEDAAELRLQQPHVIPLETRAPNLEGKGEVNLRDLLRNALRMRPDRIIIGEVRGPEALDLLQALNTGHRGSMTTVHANSPRDALSRLETMALTAGVGLPSHAVREQLEQAVDILAHMERSRCGRRRVCDMAVISRGHRGGARLVSLCGGDDAYRQDESSLLRLVASEEEEGTARKVVKVEVPSSTRG